VSAALRILQGRFGRAALLDMDRPLVTHAHHHCHVLLKAHGADTRFVVGDQICPLDDDTAVLVNAWESHSYEHYPGAPETYILAMYVEPAWLADIDRAFLGSALPGFFPQRCIRVSPEISRCARVLVDLMTCEVTLDVDEIESVIFALMIAVIERFSAWREGRARPLAGFGVGDHRVRRAIGIMKTNLGQPQDMTTLAAEAGLSRPHFFHLFKRTTGLTPGVYHNVLRFERAVAELSASDRNIGEIAIDLGFDTPGNFTRFFRQHLGIAPSEYRRVVDLFAPEVGASRSAGILGTIPVGAPAVDFQTLG